uniref:RING-type domain-containing protein n=1 Tax=Fundulus heteroclitus TaxID=8078 RepID=A0A3Q2P7X2_FUNHE
MFSSKEEQLTQELSCPICLQLYNDPVVLPCGHNYCLACICKSASSTDSGKEPPRCPECREKVAQYFSHFVHVCRWFLPDCN